MTITAPHSKIVAGLGCRPDCASTEIAALVREACNISSAMPDFLAVPWFRAGEIGVAEAAALLNLRLVTVAQTDLLAIQPRCVTRSSRAYETTGIESVAEGCALAAAGDASILLVARIAGPGSTCAIACGIVS